MPSVVEVYNIALAELGADLVMSTDQNSGGAKACTARWADVRDTVLRAHPWNCAVRRFQLPAAAPAPAYGPARRYPLPIGCLRVLEIEGGVPFTVEGRQILTDASAPLRGRYIARVEDPNEWDALLVRAVAMHLAAAVAYRLTQSTTQADRCTRLYEMAMRQARAVDATEEPAQELPEASIITARM